MLKSGGKIQEYSSLGIIGFITLPYVRLEARLIGEGVVNIEIVAVVMGLWFAR